MGVVDLAVVPTGHRSSLAEEPGSSLDVASRADTEQGNRASASANTADADSVEEPGQENDADSPAARTVAEKHEQDEDLGVLPSSATMAGVETSGQNGELGASAEATMATQPAAGSTMPISHQPVDGAAVRTLAPATTSPATPATADQPLPASAAGGRDGGAAPGGADGGADRHTLRLPPHHGGAAPQAGRGDAAHQPSRLCLSRAGAGGLR